MRYAACALIAILTCLTACKPSAGGANVNRGAGIYFKNCVVCHGQNGEPREPAYPPLRHSEWLRGETAPLIALVLDGATGPFEVNGRTYQGVMPAWREILSDDEIADVLNFIRVNFVSANPTVRAQDVAELRDRTKARQKFWTQDELKALVSK